MSILAFDWTRFNKENYDLNDPLGAAKFLRTTMDFMDLLREDQSPTLDTDGLLIEFCFFVDDSEVWHLAQTVVPEFRTSADAQCVPCVPCDTLLSVESAF